MKDGKFLYQYDALNRIVEIRNKVNNKIVAKYLYDYMNRRIQKDFQEKIAGACNEENGEHTTDANTLLLYHFNNENGTIVDSSGNNNNITQIKNTTRVDGLFNTKGLRFDGKTLNVPLSATLDNYQDQISVEAFVFLEPLTAEQEIDLGRRIISRKENFTLRISKTTRKPIFKIHTLNDLGEVVKTVIPADTEIPLNTWGRLEKTTVIIVCRFTFFNCFHFTCDICKKNSNLGIKWKLIK